MRKFTTILKTIPFQLTTVEGEVDLEFSEYSVSDISRLIELQKPLINGEGVGSLNDLYRTRIMCSVKHAGTNDYYWPEGIESFNALNLPSGLIDQLTECVNELNPIAQIQEDLNAKKNNS